MINSFNYKTHILIGILIGVLASLVLFFFPYRKRLASLSYKSQILPTELPTPSHELLREKAQVQVSPTPEAFESIFDSSTPIPTVSAKREVSERDEEMLIRKLLADFEMFVGVRNTAGALYFFTPPRTIAAREKYENIRTKNLPYGLNSWSFIEDSFGRILKEEMPGGYKVRMRECRTNIDYCEILTFELVRDEKAKNGFSISRYYVVDIYNVDFDDESIKYQGFYFD